MWTPEARAAALAARQANAQGKQPQQRRKPGPQTAAHPNPGNRVAFATRNRMIHDAGRGAREAAAHQRAIGAAVPNVGRALLGMLLGAGGAILHSAIGQQLRGGGRR